MSLGLVRFNALHQIESYDPQLVKFTVSSFDFRFCNITCQVGNLRVNCRPKNLYQKTNFSLLTEKKKKRNTLKKKIMFLNT